MRLRSVCGCDAPSYPHIRSSRVTTTSKCRLTRPPRALARVAPSRSVWRGQWPRACAGSRTGGRSRRVLVGMWKCFAFVVVFIHTRMRIFAYNTHAHARLCVQLSCFQNRTGEDACGVKPHSPAANVPPSGWAAIVATLGKSQVDNFVLQGTGEGGAAVSPCGSAAALGAPLSSAPCDYPGTNLTRAPACSLVSWMPPRSQAH